MFVQELSERLVSFSYMIGGQNWHKAAVRSTFLAGPLSGAERTCSFSKCMYFSESKGNMRRLLLPRHQRLTRARPLPRRPQLRNN